MLSSRTAIRASTLSTTKSSSIRSLSLLSNNQNSLLNSSNNLTSSNGALTNNNQALNGQQQSRSLVGLVHAIDKRVYRWAKGVLPPISKTENIALGCGTIGKFSLF